MAKESSSKGALTGDSVPLPNLPDEIIAEILPRLPVKSLLKFRCVSKSWRSLISSPDFIQTHLLVSTKNNPSCHNRFLGGFDYHRPMIFHTVELNPNMSDGCDSSEDTSVLDCDSKYYSIRIVGSCNGLVCVVLDYCSVVLWNPATRRSKKLACSGVNGDWIEYGFGYDATRDDYKVVEVNSFCDDDEEEDGTRVKVYSWRGDLWRDVIWPGSRISSDGAGVLVNGVGVLVNGVIHWNVYRGSPSKWDLIALNVTMDTWSGVELPRHGRADVDGVMLGAVSGECLCVLYDYISYINVWVMREYGVQESWTKLACVFDYFSVSHFTHERPKMLFVSEDGDILLRIGSCLILYEPPNCYDSYSLWDDAEVEGVTYSESLVSPEFDRVGQR